MPVSSVPSAECGVQKMLSVPLGGMLLEVRKPHLSHFKKEKEEKKDAVREVHNLQAAVLCVCVFFFFVCNHSIEKLFHFKRRVTPSRCCVLGA